MPKPNPKVVIALLESYLTMRKSGWSVEELPNGKLKLPEPDSLQGTKIAICHKLLKKISSVKSMDDWIKFAYDLHGHEKSQKALYNSQYFGINHVLLDVLRAIRCYVINTMSSESEFKTCVEALKALQVTHEQDVLRLSKFTDGHNPNELPESKIELENTNKQLKSLELKGDYLNEYFTRQIVPYDVKYAELKEADFDAFITSVKDSNRPGTLCKKVLDSMNVVLQAAATPAEANNNAEAEIAHANTVKNPDVSRVQSDAKKPEVKKTTSTKPSRSALRQNSKFTSPAADLPPRTRKAPVKFADQDYYNTPLEPNTNHTRSTSRRKHK